MSFSVLKWSSIKKIEELEILCITWIASNIFPACWQLPRDRSSRDSYHDSYPNNVLANVVIKCGWIYVCENAFCYDCLSFPLVTVIIMAWLFGKNYRWQGVKKLPSWRILSLNLRNIFIPSWSFQLSYNSKM